ncbi:MAG: aminopeptidase P family protein [Coriobacteriales bacterium]|nr:aminopeptidase P family protein [Coriobacteriales bacterium]
MTVPTSAYRRLGQLRELMARRGYDAVVLRDLADIRWFSCAARVLDDEDAHTLFVSGEGAWLHTDSRYFGAFVQAMGEGSPFAVDMEDTTHPAWVARHIVQARARVVAVEDTLSLGFYGKLSAAVDQASAACLFAQLHGDIARMRMVKDADELELLRRAQCITDEAFAHICTFIRPGLTELQIRAELEGYMLAHGAHALSFDSIVASGPNGANPHARPGERVVERGDLIVIDFGAGYGDYHADMTRTVCVGSPSAEQRKVYDIVRRAHEACAKAARPGMGGKELHALSQRIIAEAGYGDYYKHGLGHGVGIQIHEHPRVGARSTDVLPQGSVFTIEPGIYLPGKFGIRLEDFGVMGEHGFEPITQSAHDLACVG